MPVFSVDTQAVADTAARTRTRGIGRRLLQDFLQDKAHLCIYVQAFKTSTGFFERMGLRNKADFFTVLSRAPLRKTGPIGQTYPQFA